MIAAHDESAKRTGASILIACGYDAIPAELGVWLCQKIAREELNAAFEVQRAEWEAIRAEILQASLDTDTNMRGLMASFLAKLGEVTGGFAHHPPASDAAPATAGAADAMPRRSR